MVRFRVLVTGATGFLGPHATAGLRRRGHQVLTSGGHGGDHPADLADPAARAALLSTTRPDLVLHLAARSRMGHCQQDPEGARRINAAVPEALARELGDRLLHVSTDLVFDGRSAPYAADDPVGPLSAYGASKAEGEERVLALGGRVVRVPLLFGPDPRDQGATGMIRAGLRAGTPVMLYTNEYRTPLHARDAAEGLADLLVLRSGPRLAHLAGPERVSRWELGLRFCALQGLSAELLQAVECQDATRPRDVSLTSVWECPRPLDAMLRDG